MNFYSASVALLWTTAMGLRAPAAVRSQEVASISLRIAGPARRLRAPIRNSSRVGDAAPLSAGTQLECSLHDERRRRAQQTFRR
jgi:hypothetical protein